MILDLEDIKSITTGAEYVEYTGDSYKFFRFTKEEQSASYDYLMDYPAGVRMEFFTDAEKLKLKVKISDTARVRTYFSFDVFEDGKLIGTIQNLPEEQRVGNYAHKEYKIGSFCGEFDLSGKRSQVEIVFPYSVIAEIESMELCGATYIEKVEKEKKYLSLGDSITQGYDSLHTSATYAYRIARMLCAEHKNKAIAGAVFNPRLIAAADENYKPDYISVAYGTNDWSWLDEESFKSNAEEYLSILVHKYPNAKIAVISPIWRADFQAITPFGKFSRVSEVLFSICEKYPSVQFIEGIDLVAHSGEYFGDLALHPSDEGFSMYFEGLADKIFKE